MMATTNHTTNAFLEKMKTLVEPPHPFSDVNVMIKGTLTPPNEVIKLTHEPLSLNEALKKHNSHSTSTLAPESPNITLMPCHSFILCMNSQYFANALEFPKVQIGQLTQHFQQLPYCSKDKQTGRPEDQCTNKPTVKPTNMPTHIPTDRPTDKLTIQISVETGQVEHTKMLIRSFYNPSILYSCEPEELLCVGRVADMLICEDVVVQLSTTIGQMQIPSFHSCQALMDRLVCLGGTQCTEAFRNLLNKLERKCLSHLASYFCPLETKIHRHVDFLSLDVNHLIAILESEQNLAHSEKSLLAFIAEWFSFDQSRCIDVNFERIFKTMRASELTTDYLVHHVIGHPVLCRWTGFDLWTAQLLSYIAVRADLRSKLPHNQFSIAKSRNVPPFRESVSPNHWKPGQRIPFGEDYGMPVKFIRSSKQLLDSDYYQLGQCNFFLVNDGIKLTPKLHYNHSAGHITLDYSSSQPSGETHNSSASISPGCVVRSDHPGETESNVAQPNQTETTGHLYSPASPVHSRSYSPQPLPQLHSWATGSAEYQEHSAPNPNRCHVYHWTVTPIFSVEGFPRFPRRGKPMDVPRDHLMQQELDSYVLVMVC